MKAKFLIIIGLLAGLLTSCNMDLMPEGALEESTAIQNFNDASHFRNSLYIGMKNFCTSQFITYADIQTDKFNGLIINGNRMGSIANGNVMPSDGDITGYWGAIYSFIANTNYFLSVMEPLYEKAVADNDLRAMQEYPHFIGEAHFFRGYFYAMMFDRWCPLYTPEKGDQPGLGLPIVTEYSPSADRSKYPGRSTMNETIKFFKDEIQKGYDALSKYEEVNSSYLVPNANYLSSYAVRAMQARIALWLGNYQEAKSLAEDVINSKNYTLSTVSNYANIWTQDKGEELIFVPFMSKTELSNSIGASWIGTLLTQADYIPTPQLIKSYEEGGKTGKNYNDVRYSAFMSERKLSTAYGDIKTMCFTKFPGNPNFIIGDSPNLMNMPKPFRLSEMYLIAAESAYELGETTEANNYLNELLKNRIKLYVSTNYEGVQLREAIRNERMKELVGEGFRLSDLRRWHLGFDRSIGDNYPSTPDVDLLLTNVGLAVSYQPDDYRYTWPIPSDELQSNPQIANQQNPGY